MPITRFDTDATLAKRALQIYLILIGCADRRETITYEILASKMGYDRGAGVLADRLGPIMRWCAMNGQPALTAIVVKKGTGLPGDGLETVEDNKFSREQQRVFEHPWFDFFPPDLTELT